MLSIFKKAITTERVTQEPSKNDKAVPSRSRGALALNKNCTKCGVCAEKCPRKALKVNKKGISVDYSACIFCGLCIDKCETGALKHTGFYQLAKQTKKNLVAPLGELEDLKESLNKQINKVFGRSLHIRHLDAGSCNGCDWEMTAMTNPIYDLQHLGLDIVASPRHADILLVTGSVTKNLEQAVRMTYEAVPAPKMVMAVGSCAIDGGIFKGSDSVLNGADKVIPVDIYVPGCPPRPQAIIYGLLHLLNRV